MAARLWSVCDGARAPTGRVSLLLHTCYGAEEGCGHVWRSRHRRTAGILDLGFRISAHRACAARRRARRDGGWSRAAIDDACRLTHGFPWRTAGWQGLPALQAARSASNGYLDQVAIVLSPARRAASSVIFVAPDNGNCLATVWRLAIGGAVAGLWGGGWKVGASARMRVRARALSGLTRTLLHEFDF